MSDLVNDAVTGTGKEAFTDLRKLAACGIALATGGSGTEAAVEADKGVFQTALDYAVGNGVISGQDAVELAIDRVAAHFVTVARQAVAQLVEKGCVAVGTWLGSLVGQPQLGAAVGTAVAKVLTPVVQAVVTKGINMVREVAKTGWRALKEGIASFVSSVVDTVCSWLGF